MQPLDAPGMECHGLQVRTSSGGVELLGGHPQVEVGHPNLLHVDLLELLIHRLHKLQVLPHQQQPLHEKRISLQQVQEGSLVQEVPDVGRT